MKYQLLDPFLTISHIIYFCYALSKGYYVSGNNKWSETVESSSLNMTFNLKGPGDIPVVGGWELEAEPRAKRCKMPPSKLNTTTAVWNHNCSHLHGGHIRLACQQLREEKLMGPYSLLLTLTDSGKGGDIFSCLPTAESTRLQTKWGDECEKEIYRNRLG